MPERELGPCKLKLGQGTKQRRPAADRESLPQVLLRPRQLAQVEPEAGQAVVRGRDEMRHVLGQDRRALVQPLERGAVVAEGTMHVAELHLNEQGAGAQFGEHLLESTRLLQGHQRGRDLAHVVKTRAEIGEHDQLAGPVAFGPGQGDDVAHRRLRLGVAIAGIEQDAEVGVVLDLAMPVAEAQQARFGGSHRVGSRPGAILHEQAVGEGAHQIDIQLVGGPARLGLDRGQPGPGGSLGGGPFALLGQRVRSREIRVAALERIGRERIQQIEAFEVRRAAQAGLQVRAVRTLEQLESACPVAAVGSRDARGEHQQGAFLGRPPGGGGAVGRGDQPGERTELGTSVEPVLGDVRRLGLAGFEKARHLGVQLPGDRRRHRAQRRLEDQVVGEDAFAQDLCRVELGPGIAQVEGADAEHVCRQLGRKIGTGDRRAARKLDRHRGEPADPLLDQVGDVHCRRQPRCQRHCRGRRSDADQGRRHEHELERLEQEHRIAASVSGQCRSQARRFEAGDAERIDQVADVLGLERLQHVQARTAGTEEHVMKGLGGRRELVCAERHDPAQAQPGGRQMLHRFDAGGVGELEVVDDQSRDAFAVHLAQRRFDRVDETHAVRAAAHRRGTTELRQQVGELIHHAGW